MARLKKRVSIDFLEIFLISFATEIVLIFFLGLLKTFVIVSIVLIAILLCCSFFDESD